MFSALISVRYRKLRYCFSGDVIRYCYVIPYPNDNVTNGNRPQNIVSHLVPDQTTVSHLLNVSKPIFQLVLGQKIVIHIYILVLTLKRLKRITILCYQKDYISIWLSMKGYVQKTSRQHLIVNFFLAFDSIHKEKTE